MIRRATLDRRVSGYVPKAAFNIANYYGPNGITTHLDADQGITLNGSTVSQWTDLVSSQAFVQATAANQPTYATNQANGHSTVNLDAATKNLRLSGMAALVNPECTIFIVQKTTANGFGFGRANPAGNLGFIYNSTTGNINFNTLAGGNLQDGLYSTTAYQVISCRWQATGGFGTNLTTLELYVNGTQQTTTGVPTYSNPGASSLATVGWTGSTGNHQVAAVLFAENKMMTTTDHSAIVNWLRTKYGTG